MTRRLTILATLSGIMGLLASLIFWVIYFLQSFDAPISNTTRILSAFIGTTGIFLVVIAIMFRGRIMAHLRWLFDPESDYE